MLPFAIYLDAARPALRGLWWLCSAVLVGALFGTLSRGALVGLAAVVLWAVATRRTRLGGVVAGRDRGRAACCAGAHAVAAADRRAPGGQEPGRAGQRRVARGVLARRADDGGRPPAAGGRARPLRGREPRATSSTTRSTSTDPVVHNAYLEVLAEGGVPTLIAFLAFIAGSWRLPARARRRFEARGRRRRPADRPPPSRRRSWWRSCRRTSSRCRSRSRCGCSAGWPRCCALRATRAARVKVALVTSIPYGGPLEHAVLLARDLRRARRGRARGGGATTEARGAVRRRRARGSRSSRSRAPFDPAGAVRVHRFVRGADVDPLARPPQRAVGAARAGAGALRVHTLHGLPEPYLDGPPRPEGARLAYGGLERAAARPTCSSPPRTRWRGCCAERLGYGETRRSCPTASTPAAAAAARRARRDAVRCSSR